jgi:hypothetical protein
MNATEGMMEEHVRTTGGKQCSGSVTFWYGSECGCGSLDPYLCLTDPDADADSDPDPCQNLQ